MYAFLFDEEVYYHFTEYILHQPKDRLMWGAGRIMHHENLYGIVQKWKLPCADRRLIIRTISAT